DGFHAQSHTPSKEEYIKFELKMDKDPAVTFGEPVYPKGKDEFYPNLNDTLNVYTGRVVIYVPIELKSDAKPGAIKLKGKLTYQICDNNVCYPPESPKFEVETKIIPAGEEVKPNEEELFKGYKAK